MSKGGWGVKYQVGDDVHELVMPGGRRRWNQLAAIHFAAEKIDDAGADHAWIVDPEDTEHEVKIP